MKKKKYQLVLSGYAKEIECNLLFSFCIPTIFGTEEEALKTNNDYKIVTKQLENGEIVFDIYDCKGKEKHIDTITWADKKKYSLEKCYEPYMDKSPKSFRDLFEEFLNKKMYSINDVHNHKINIVAYDTKAIFVTE